MEHVLESDTEPIWLEKMLEDSRWRLMLIGLAEKHKVSYGFNRMGNKNRTNVTVKKSLVGF